LIAGAYRQPEFASSRSSWLKTIVNTINFAADFFAILFFCPSIKLQTFRAESMSLHWKTRIEQRFAQRREQQLWRERVLLQSPQGTRIVVGGRELLNFSSNDYLGLANHPRLRTSAIKAVEQWGCGSGASHLVCGHSELHEQLETELAQFVGAEKSVLFSTGYMANLAIPQTFLTRHDQVVTDKLNHASLIDGAVSASNHAKVARYPHGDWEAAQVHLENSHSGLQMLLTDGVFSMDGDLAPLPQLSAISQKQLALLVVDDAHGFGVLGTMGAGTLEHFQIPVREHILMMGTLGKAAGSFGAFVAGDRIWIDALVQFARTYIYTTALPPVVAAMALEALAIFRDEPDRRNRLHKNVDHFRNLAKNFDLELGESQTPIQPVFPKRETASESANTNSTQFIVHLSQRLRQQGFLVMPIRPPTVPVGTDRLRVTLTSEHTQSEIEALVTAIADCVNGLKAEQHR
jgi:8-amino-7-oxononanoate synthase